MAETYFQILIEKLKVINPNKIVWFAFKSAGKEMLDCNFDIIVVTDELSKPHIDTVKTINHLYVMSLIKELHQQRPFLLLINTLTDYNKFMQRADIIVDGKNNKDIRILYERK